MKTNENYRGYFFGNFYLSSIQQGIQAAHVIQEMTKKYEPLRYSTNAATEIFRDWCFEDKTMILLNGGMHQSLYEVYSRLLEMTNRGTDYPVALFNEERAALNETITCVGIVLPKSVYNFWGNVGPDESIVKTFRAKDVKLHEYITSFKLAN